MAVYLQGFANRRYTHMTPTFSLRELPVHGTKMTVSVSGLSSENHDRCRGGIICRFRRDCCPDSLAEAFRPEAMVSVPVPAVRSGITAPTTWIIPITVPHLIPVTIVRDMERLYVASVASFICRVSATFTRATGEARQACHSSVSRQTDAYDTVYLKAIAR